jgi:hypothetical protein
MELVRFILPEGLPVVVEKESGENFEYRMKRDTAFYAFSRDKDPFSSLVRFKLTATYFVWVHLKYVIIEGAKLCEKCRGIGNVVVSNWRAPERCYRCRGKGFMTQLDEQFYAEWHQKKHGRPLFNPDADDLPIPF